MLVKCTVCFGLFILAVFFKKLSNSANYQDLDRMHTVPNFENCDDTTHYVFFSALMQVRMADSEKYTCLLAPSFSLCRTSIGEHLWIIPGEPVINTCLGTVLWAMLSPAPHIHNNSLETSQIKFSLVWREK